MTQARLVVIEERVDADGARLGLLGIMTSISEDNWCAGWMKGSGVLRPRPSRARPARQRTL